VSGRTNFVATVQRSQGSIKISSRHRQYAGGQNQSSGAERRNLFVKIEAFNPLGSVKDRLALGGMRPPKDRAVETRTDRDRGDQREHGIGLACLRGQGYPLVLTMAEPFASSAAS
jgi:hypothetical protein